MTEQETIDDLLDRLSAALDSERIYKEQLEALKDRFHIVGEHCFRAGFSTAKTEPKFTEADVPRRVSNLIGNT